MNNSGEFLSFDCEFKNKYNIETNFLQYYQITSAIPQILKVKAFQQIATPLNLFHSNTIYLSKNISINFEKFRCKQFYNLLMENQTSVPTAVKSWGRNHPNIANRWESSGTFTRSPVITNFASSPSNCFIVFLSLTRS